MQDGGTGIGVPIASGGDIVLGQPAAKKGLPVKTLVIIGVVLGVILLGVWAFFQFLYVNSGAIMGKVEEATVGYENLQSAWSEEYGSMDDESLRLMAAGGGNPEPVRQALSDFESALDELAGMRGALNDQTTVLLDDIRGVIEEYREKQQVFMSAQEKIGGDAISRLIFSEVPYTSVNDMTSKVNNALSFDLSGEYEEGWDDVAKSIRDYVRLFYPVSSFVEREGGHILNDEAYAGVVAGLDSEAITKQRVTMVSKIRAFEESLYEIENGDAVIGWLREYEEKL